MQELPVIKNLGEYPPNYSNDSVGIVQAAEVCLTCKDLHVDLCFFTKKLGFRLDKIFPADDPAVAEISGHGLRIRLERGNNLAPGTLRLICNDPKSLVEGEMQLQAPNGTHIEIVDANLPLQTPKPKHAFVVNRLQDDSPWIEGRAGMQYRDLIPDRLGGCMIASHIRISQGGPVPDMVHYHTIGFQLIFCYKGWVKVVYEDQGPPFVLKAGDCVIQPPDIRHRVLESSDNLEVVEIAVPAQHVTTVDHELELPTPHFNPERNFGGQKFCRHEVQKAVWNPWRLSGFSFRETGICHATAGLASVQVARYIGNVLAQVTSHTADILFSYVTQGRLTLQVEGQKHHVLSAGDAFVIPPNLKTSLANCSEDLEFLQASLPGNFKTVIHAEVNLSHGIV